MKNAEMLDEEYKDRNDSKRYMLGRIGGYCCHCVSTSRPNWPYIHSRRRNSDAVDILDSIVEYW
jgi:hypothetical protein